MTTQIIQTDAAPEAIGTYSQGVVHNGVLYTSGQIALEPGSGSLVSKDADRQIRQVFKNLAALAEAAGTRLQNTIKLNVYLVDLSHYEAVNSIMAEFFDPPYPARAALQVAALPRAALVEMDALIALED